MLIYDYMLIWMLKQWLISSKTEKYFSCYWEKKHGKLPLKVVILKMFIETQVLLRKGRRILDSSSRIMYIFIGLGISHIISGFYETPEVLDFKQRVSEFN